MIDGFSHFIRFYAKSAIRACLEPSLRQTASPFTSLICLRSLFMRLRFW